MNKFLSIIIAMSILISTTACTSKPVESNVSTSMSIIKEIESSSSEYIDEKPLNTDNPSLGEKDSQSSSDKIDDVANIPSSQQSNTSQSISPKESNAPVVSSTASVSSLEQSSILPKESSTEAPNTQSNEFIETPPTFNNSDVKSATHTISAVDEVRAVWISYLDFYTILQGKTEKEFKANMNKVYSNISGLGFNTVIVQVRPYADALYKSSYFPWSYVVTGEEGVNPEFDPLEIMVDMAHEQDIRIEAWINPYRVRTSGMKQAISSKSPAAKMKSTGAVIEYNGGTYFNPSSADARNLITNGVKEIVENYAVDGIHFDDYFYPTQDSAFDKSYYTAYVKAGGKLSLADWRRDNVNKLVKQVYGVIKSVDSNVLFGISPQANFENNYDKQYIDVEKWVTTSGYVDYICPQVYFGFKNSAYPYTSTVKRWNDMITAPQVKLYIGLAPYKVGLEDKWAGDGINEWRTDKNLLSSMVLTARKNGNYNGFFMYRYDSLFNPDASVKTQILSEIAALKKEM